jgi:hypothetical protein
MSFPYPAQVAQNGEGPARQGVFAQRLHSVVLLAEVPVMATTDEIPENDATRLDPEPSTGNEYLRDLFNLAPEEILPDPVVLPG